MHPGYAISLFEMFIYAKKYINIYLDWHMQKNLFYNIRL